MSDLTLDEKEIPVEPSTVSPSIVSGNIPQNKSDLEAADLPSDSSREAVDPGRTIHGFRVSSLTSSFSS